MTIGGCAACGVRERSSAHQTIGAKDLYPLVELGSTKTFDSSWPFAGAASGAPSELRATPFGWPNPQSATRKPQPATRNSQLLPKHVRLELHQNSDQRCQRDTMEEHKAYNS